MNQKKIEAEIAKAAKVAFHRIITPAAVSKMPVSPNRIIIKGVAVILGMLGAMALLFLVHSLKARVNDVSIVEENSMIPVIASVPKLKKPVQKANFFLTTVTQWQVRKLLQPQGITCLTGFEQRQGTRFIAEEVIRTLHNQGRSILVVELEETTTNRGFWSLESINEQTTKITLDCAKMMCQTTEEIQAVLLAQSRDHDQTIVVNSNFGEAFTLALMAIATVNIVGVDTRLTPAKKIVEVDLLSTEYQLPNVHFAVNRVGYNPSFIWEIFRGVKHSFRWIKTATK